MKLDEKREVIEALLSEPGENALSIREGLDETIRRLAHNEYWRIEFGCGPGYDHECLEAAYRLIESSPTLRREWFGAR